MKFISYILILVLLSFSMSIPVQADEISDLTNQLNKLKADLNSSKNATKPLEGTVQNLAKQLEGIKYKIVFLQGEVVKKEKEVEKGEKVMEYQKKLLDVRTNEYYKNSKKVEVSFLNLLASDNLSVSLQNFFYQKTLSDQDKKSIVRIASYIHDLEEKKASLETERNQLSGLQKEVDKQSQFLSGEIDKAKKYQGDLEKQIAELSAKQQSIINSRSGTTTFNMGDVDLSGDSNASRDWFRSSAPGGYFAVFSFGAHTHRKGMSQYGARGRAQIGQNFRDILRAYYGKEPVSKDTGGNIKVTGQGEIDFEGRYLLGIAEMPSNWHVEALKAQAIAARTYAYRYKLENREICTTEACQVFLASKADNPPAAWRQAVEETRGQVLEDVVTFYASTHGGYTTTSGWDTTDGQSGANFVDRTYEKLGGSPWLYKAWYTQGYSNSSSTCGRANPWLSPTEMADIVNAALVITRGTSEEASRITPVTTNCHGGNPYSHDELRNIASRYGGIASADSVSVAQGNGTTASVTINGVTLSGSDFKRAFNLRAPGYLAIPQFQFAFFNIEKK
ncbi:MAG TPA: SpoIID/LytB domain-containing protein [Candidatus Nitrosocosmicus sp.]|nr:SpoIID/LytB domain-containing protein [Candidatus Nitrosocosmicus sp.]